MNFLQLCQEIVVKPCETDICRWTVYSIIGTLFLVVIIAAYGILSGGYQRAMEEKYKNVHDIRRKKK